MEGDSYDSSFDEIYNMDMYGEHSAKRRKMKEYLQKWKGYSTTDQRYSYSKADDDYVSFLF